MPRRLTSTPWLRYIEPDHGQFVTLPHAAHEPVAGNEEAESRDEYVASPSGGMDEEEIIVLIAAVLVRPAIEPCPVPEVERDWASQTHPVTKQPRKLEVMELVDHPARHAGLVRVRQCPLDLSVVGLPT